MSQRERDRAVFAHFCCPVVFSAGCPLGKSGVEREKEREAGSNISSSMALTIDAAPCMPAVISTGSLNTPSDGIKWLGVNVTGS